jgi:murein DD-endopeptidase MepM/ murein hydrolase activator NlpD
LERLQVLVALKRKNRFLNLSVPAYTLYLVGALVAGLLVFGGVALFRTTDYARLSALARENASLKAQVRNYTAAIDTFRQFLTATEQMDNRLRAAANLSLIPADVRLMGVGGTARPEPQVRVDNLLRRVRLERQSLCDIEAALNANQARLANTPSIWPVQGWVTSDYGYRADPFTGRNTLHPGLDIVAPAGSDIVAAADGRVVFSGWKSGWGRVVEIDHGWGVRTFYAHCRSLIAGQGKQVRRGDRIATVGSSGRATGVHLHYGVTVNGNWTDPANYIITQVAER